MATPDRSSGAAMDDSPAPPAAALYRAQRSPTSTAFDEPTSPIPPIDSSVQDALHLEPVLVRGVFYVRNNYHIVESKIDTSPSIVWKWLLTKLRVDGSEARDILKTNSIKRHRGNVVRADYKLELVSSHEVDPASALSPHEKRIFRYAYRDGQREGARRSTDAHSVLLTATNALSANTNAQIKMDSVIHTKLRKGYRVAGVPLARLNYAAIQRKMAENQQRPLALKSTDTRSITFGRSLINGVAFDCWKVIYLSELYDAAFLNDERDGELVSSAIANALKGTQYHLTVESQYHPAVVRLWFPDDVKEADETEVKEADETDVPRPSYTARIGFQSQSDRDGAVPVVRSWVATLDSNDQANLRLGSKRVAVNASYHSFPTQVVPKLLAQLGGGELPLTFTSDNPYHLDLVIWLDNSRKQTVGRCRFIDPGRRRYPTGVSDIETFLHWVGGEEALPSVIGPSVEQMESLSAYQWVDRSGATITCSVGYADMDHHAETIVSGQVGASSPFRGPYDLSLATHWARVPFQGALLRTVGDVLANHDGLMRFVQAGFEEYSSDRRDGLETLAANSVLTELMSRGTRIYKKVNGEPLLCRTSGAHLAKVFRGQPMMHNINAVIMVALELLFLHVVPITSKERQRWVWGMLHCESLYVKGEFTSSAQQMRQLGATFSGMFEDALFAVLGWRLRKYAIAPRLITYVAALYYGRDTNSVIDQLAHGVCALLAGLLVTDMSAWFGGKEPTKPEDHRLATDSNYYHDFMCITPQCHLDLASRRVLMRWLLEESFEASFKDDHAVIEKLRTSGNLGPQIKLLDRIQARRVIAPDPTSVRSKHRSTDSCLRVDMLVCGCAREMLTQVRFKVKDQWHEVERPGYPMNSLPIAPFAWRRYLRQMPPAQQELVICLARLEPRRLNDLLFPIGRRPSALRNRIKAGEVPRRYCVCGEEVCTCDGARPQDLLVVCCCDKTCDTAVREDSQPITLAQFNEQIEVASVDREVNARRLLLRWVRVTKLNRQRLAEAEAKLETYLKKSASPLPHLFVCDSCVSCV
jgi:hypothetical protein